MKKGSLLTGLLLLASVAQAEKSDHIEQEVAALAKWLLLVVGGSVAAVIVLISWLIIRQRRKRWQARERERLFYESL